jgi:hypothetical protein
MNFNSFLPGDLKEALNRELEILQQTAMQGSMDVREYLFFVYIVDEYGAFLFSFFNVVCSSLSFSFSVCTSFIVSRLHVYYIYILFF